MTSIDEGAFSYCKELKSIILRDTVELIGENAFFEADGLVICCFEDSYVHQYALLNRIEVCLDLEHLLVRCACGEFDCKIYPLCMPCPECGKVGCTKYPGCTNCPLCGQKDCELYPYCIPCPGCGEIGCREYPACMMVDPRPACE